MDSNDNTDGPPQKIAKLDENNQIISQDEVFLSDQEIESLLDDNINFYKEEIKDQQSIPFNKSFFAYFSTILNNDAINNYETKAQCEKLVELCVLKLDEDSLPLLDLLAMVFNPSNKFHTLNAARMSQSAPPGSNIPDDKLYARALLVRRIPHGWLVDLINKFGNLGGFAILFARFQRGRRKLTIPLVQALLRPFRPCHEFLTVHTVEKYFLPIAERLQEIFHDLTDEELKNQATSNELIYDLISAIIDTMKSILSCVPEQKEVLNNLESSRPGMMLCPPPVSQDIVKLLAKEVCDMSSDDLDNFLQSLKATWITGGKAEREQFLGFIQRSAMNVRNDFFVQEVLTLFWNLAHSNGIATKIMNQALNAQNEILKSVCLEFRDARKIFWLNKCVEELKSADNWTLPALKQIRNIHSTFDSKLGNPNVYHQGSILSRLKNLQNVINLVTDNLKKYMATVRQLVREDPDTNETILKPDGRYNHVRQVEKRLDFVNFVADSGFLCTTQARQIWQCLVQEAVFRADRETCFKWFSNIITEKPPRNPILMQSLFYYNILQVDTRLLTRNGIECFQRFFDAVNRYSTDFYNEDTIGINYLWNIIENSAEDIARHGFEVLHKFNAALGSQSQLSDSEIHKTLLAQCKERLQFHCEALSILPDANSEREPNFLDQAGFAMETKRMDRVLKFMQAYNDEFSWSESESD